MHITPCSLGPISSLPALDGRPRVRADCACGISFGAWDEPQLRRRFADHLAVTRPPAFILAKPEPSWIDVQAWQEFFLRGPGRQAASVARCSHDFFLTDVCPACYGSRRYT